MGTHINLRLVLSRPLTLCIYPDVSAGNTAAGNTAVLVLLPTVIHITDPISRTRNFPGPQGWCMNQVWGHQGNSSRAVQESTVWG